jgi:hypothetical protein
MLPEQVRKRAERANQLVAELSGQTPSGEPAPPAPAPQEPAVPQNPPAPPASPEPTPAPSPAPTPAPVDDPNSDSWKQKYSTLQGVLAAESRRHATEKQAQDTRIANLEAEITALKKGPAPAPVAPAAQFSQDEIDRFGPELLNLVTAKASNLAEEIVTRKLAEFAPRIEQVANQVKSVGQTVYDDKEQEFWGELRKAVPDFDAVNVSPGFLAWLGQEDDASGERRQVLLDKHAARLDYTRVVKLFNAFKKEAGLTEPAPAPVSAPAPAAPPISPSPRTVGTGGSGSTPREPEAPSVKRSEIAAHYRRSSSDPTYRTKPEYTAMEQRIFQAQAAGRVIDA